MPRINQEKPDNTIKRTIKILLEPTKTQEKDFEKLVTEYNTAWNDIATKIYLEQKTGYTSIYSTYWHEMRNTHDLPSGILQAAFANATGNAKTARKQNLKKKKRKKNKQYAKVGSNGVPLMHKHRASVAYSQRAVSYNPVSGLLTFSMSEGNKRFKQYVSLPAWFDEKYPVKRATSGVLKFEDGVWVFCLTFRVPVDVATVDDCISRGVLGVDRGLYNIVYCSDGYRVSGSMLRAAARRHLYNVRALKQKGTRSSKRKLKDIKGKRARFMRDVNYKCARDIVDSGYGVVVLEDLKGIRGKRRGRKLNSWLSLWGYYQLESFIRDKAKEHGGVVVDKVGAAFTSVTCSCCGSRVTYRNKGLFVCEECGFSADADFNASLNIRSRWVVGHVDGDGVLRSGG